MWVRKVYFGSQGIAFWEVGCQCCGYIVGEWPTWAWAMSHQHNHARTHS